MRSSLFLPSCRIHSLPVLASAVQGCPSPIREAAVTHPASVLTELPGHSRNVPKLAGSGVCPPVAVAYSDSFWNTSHTQNQNKYIAQTRICCESVCLDPFCRAERLSQHNKRPKKHQAPVGAPCKLRRRVRSRKGSPPPAGVISQLRSLLFKPTSGLVHTSTNFTHASAFQIPPPLP